MASTDTKFSREIEVGKGKVYFDVQLLPLQFYSLMDDLLIGAGAGRSIGRIKDALIWNGIPTKDPNHPRKARKPISVEHPEWHGGQKTEFKLFDQSAPLNHPNAPKVEEDGEFMGYLGDRIAVEVVRANKGLQTKYENLLDMLERLAGLKEEEESAEGETAEKEFNPAFEGGSAEDSATPEPEEEAVEDKEEVPAGVGNPT